MNVREVKHSLSTVLYILRHHHESAASLMFTALLLCLISPYKTNLRTYVDDNQLQNDLACNKNLLTASFPNVQST